MIETTFLALTALTLLVALAYFVAARVELVVKSYPARGMFGLGFMQGPKMLVLSLGWWHFRLEWKGEFRAFWPQTRPIRRGEIEKGDLYEFTKHRGLNPHEKAAKRDKYHWKNTEKQEATGWLERLRSWVRPK
jgi:hypothetical protein